MINIVNVNAIKTAVSRLTPADFTGYVSDVRKLPVDQAYREVGWYRRALDLRAAGISMTPFDVMRGDEVIFDEHSVNSIAMTDRMAVLNIFPILPQMVLDLDKHGAAYAVLDTDIYGYKRQWRRLHPSSIIPRYDDYTGALTHFERYVRGTRDDADKRRFELDEVLFLWMPSDNSENRPGAGVGYTALLNATMILNQEKFSAYHFEHGAVKPTIVKVKGLNQAPPDEQKRVMGTLQRLVGGLRQAFKVIPLDADLDVHQLMSDLKDMALEELTNQQREAIMTALGIPHSLMMSNAANFATASQDDINFYDKTIIPFWNMILAPQLNEQLFSRAGLTIRAVKSRLEVFQAQEMQKAYAMLPVFDRKIMSANEIRSYMDLDPLDVDFFKEDTPSEISVSGEGNQIVIEQDEPLNDASKHLSKPDVLMLDAGDMSFKSDELEPEKTSYQDELDKWERMALKRLDEGKPDKMTLFESDVIEPVLRGWIKGALDGADDVEMIRLIFDDARAYSEHS